MGYEMPISGEWVESQSGGRPDVRSPGDGRRIRSVPRVTGADVQKAIDAARKAPKEMASPIRARAKLICKANEIACRRFDHDTRVLCHD